MQIFMFLMRMNKFYIWIPDISKDAARTRVCLKDACRAVRSKDHGAYRSDQSVQITASLILNSQLIQYSSNNVRLCMHAGNALRHDDFHNLH